jgi:ATP-dependent DNA ligase
MSALPVRPPLAPMLAKLTRDVPDDGGWLFEPKWDGFRALVFKDGDDVVLQSRDLKPLQRYFPELVAALRAGLPPRIVLDGEIVIAGDDGLDFEALLLRIHPAKTRIELLARQTPASFVAWDVLAVDDDDLRQRPLSERKRVLDGLALSPPLHKTPQTEDAAVARVWFERFEGAGLDGVVAKRLDGVYQPGKRSMIKVKHARTADVVVAGYRSWKKDQQAIGSLVLGLYDEQGELHHVGVCAAFTAARRKELFAELQPLRARPEDAHPWAAWASFDDDVDAAGVRKPGATSRWNRGKDLSWVPLRLERVAEVAYDHMQGDRFRHATHFVRWRPDKPPQDCRYDQLEVAAPHALKSIFGA